MINGKLFVFSAPSGSGKSTIVQWLMTHPALRLAFSISATSRPPRGTEQNGVEYFFLTPDEFRQKIEEDAFLEYEEVYADRYYGTLKEQVERQLAAGQNIVFDVDVKGGCRIKEYYGERAMSIFIQPPSLEELRRRLEGRGTDSREQIEERLAKAEYEMTFAPRFDHIIVNANEGSVQTEDIEIDPAEVWVTVDADGKNEISYVDPAKASAPNIHVYVKAPSDWENPNLWAWSAPDGTNAFSAWPGEALEEGDNGWLTKEVPGWINSLIVNGNDGSIQTSDISVDAGKDVWIVVSGADDAYEVSYEEPAATDDAASADMETASEEKTESKTNPAIPIAIVVVCAAAAAIIGGTVYQKKKKNNK